MASSTPLQEKPKLQLESSVNSCGTCSRAFSALVKKHHCRGCGKIHCGDCSLNQREMPQFGYVGLQVCCRACKSSMESDTTLVNTSYTAVQLMMRDMGFYQFKGELFQIGSRGVPRKLLADVKDADGGNQILRMSTITEDGGAIFKDETRRRLFAFIIKETITHPYIAQSSFAQLRDNKSIVISPFQSSGSIKDLLYINTPDMKKKKITPKSRYLDKHGVLAQGTPFEIQKIAKYGRQILEALFYLYLHGFPFPHLHSGNVIVTENDHAQLCDLENTLLCLDPKPQREIRKMLINTPEMAPEVMAFGLLLYEMALGHEKADRSLKDVKSKCPTQIYSILESILEPSDPDNAASLKSLLRLPFFQEVTLDVTVHQVVLTEKWDDRVRAVLKLVRVATSKILTPPSQPQLRSSVSGIRLSDGTSSSQAAPSVSHASSSSERRASSRNLSSSASSSSSSSASIARKPSTKSVSTSSSSNAPQPPKTTPSPPPPPSGAPAPPPPPPPSMAKSMPAPQAGRDNLMAAIRSAGGLKSVQKKK